MQVTELNPDQLDFLRQDYNYLVNNDTSLVTEKEIPNELLFDFYQGIEFVPDDFPNNVTYFIIQ